MAHSRCAQRTLTSCRQRFSALCFGAFALSLSLLIGSLDRYITPFVTGCWRVPALFVSKKLHSKLAVQAEAEDGLGQEDWRDFRARLVRQAQSDGSDNITDMTSEGADWAYQTDLLEEGSLLISVPGDYWSIRRQYFCKAVFLVFSHTPQFTAAVVLNRPTGFTTRDINERVIGDSLAERIADDILDAAGVGASAEEWKVWLGGDGEGLESWAQGVAPKYICLHTLDRLAADSREVIKGIFIIDFQNARGLVNSGQASQDDFMLFAGYTGWAPGQLQSELDRGGAWILGAANKGLLLGTPDGEEPLPLRCRLEKACAMRLADGNLHPDFQDRVGDGVHHWNQLYRALRPKEFDELDDEEESHNDVMIGRWIDAYLVKKTVEKSQRLPILEDEALPAQTILRASATHWILGRPSASWPSRSKVDPWQVPGQYLHKSVLLLRQSCTRDQPSRLVILNGPKIAGSTSSGGAVRFGGFERCDSNNLVHTPGSDVIAGSFSLPPGTLQELLDLNALQVVSDVDLDVLLGTESADMWQAAGGKLETLAEVSAAAQGDKQRRKWYRAFLELNLAAGE